ncbi:hypothetical protein QBC34DRAFT_413554 [Podospora aff. communis PSN243]|uniref:Uncharacterized protein n=1 Tax=Podospora aff. communis PSN243 TaxID=3040156 RepID=A0AAV9GA34_9PEZI|nr:hypothetical protein QBC34DRAFT_413554 [Podospora aff. communis PSN243]
MTSLEKAHEQHPNLQADKVEAGQPVFLVVGAQAMVPKPGLKLTTLGKPNPRNIVPHRIGTESQDSIETNSHSIMAVLLWPGQENDGSRKVSLYTGGDAEDPQEGDFIKWLKRDHVPTDANRKIKVSTVKVGHHGSKFATNAKWTDITVDRWVISSGKKHDHPSTESILFPVFLLRQRNR